MTSCDLIGVHVQDYVCMDQFHTNCSWLQNPTLNFLQNKANNEMSCVEPEGSRQIIFISFSIWLEKMQRMNRTYQQLSNQNIYGIDTYPAVKSVCRGSKTLLLLVLVLS